MTICARRQPTVSPSSIGCSRAHLAPTRVPIGRAAVRQAESGHSLPGLFESCRGTPRQHHCALCAFFCLPGDPRRRGSPVRRRLCVVKPFMWPCRCPYRALAWKCCSHRESLPTAQPGWLLLSLKEGKNKRGAFRSQRPHATKPRGFTFHL